MLVDMLHESSSWIGRNNADANLYSDLDIDSIDAGLILR